jgi:hypothetical protein
MKNKLNVIVAFILLITLFSVVIHYWGKQARKYGLLKSDFKLLNYDSLNKNIFWNVGNTRGSFYVSMKSRTYNVDGGFLTLNVSDSGSVIYSMIDNKGTTVKTGIAVQKI